jgi:hypothetical protein
MQPRIFASVMTVVASVLIVSPLVAQVCVLEDTLGECEARVKAHVAEEAQKEGSKVVSRLAEKNPGVSPALQAQATTVEDFVSLLRVSVDAGGLNDNDENEGTVALELNDFLGLPVNDGYKVQAVIRKPQLFQPLTEAIPEETRPERISDLGKQLVDFDDVSFSFTYSPMGEKLGRKYKLHDSQVSDLFNAAKDEITPTSKQSTAEEEALGDLMAAIINAHPQLLEAQETNSLTFAMVRDAEENDSLAFQLLRATERAEYSRLLRLERLKEALARWEFFRFADLISNQPQLNVSLEAILRDDLVGPDEVRISATYEMGWVNVNDFREFKRDCQEQVLSCYAQYMTKERIRQLTRGDRLAVSFQYTAVEDYEFALDDDVVDLDIKGDQKLVLGVTYGRYIDFTKEGRGLSRLDLGLAYEDVGDDPNRDDRALISATYSQRVATMLVLSVGVTYSNEPEFIGTGDESVSVGAGLNYRLFRDEEF